MIKKTEVSMRKRLGAETRLLDEILGFGCRLKEEWLQEPGILLRLVRRRMKMTQTRLSKLSGVSQANIAFIESGKKRATLATLEKLFGALQFRIALIPIGDASPDQLLRKQAVKIAEKNLEPIFGSMALEDQLPSKRVMKEMVEEEALRLLDRETSRIWNEKSN